MKSFANYQRIIYVLNNDKLRSRHWDILQEKTGIHTDQEYLSFKLNLFLVAEIDQVRLEKVIADTIDIAEEEARIEDELTVIRLRWEERKFILTREPIALSQNSGGGGAGAGSGVGGPGGGGGGSGSSQAFKLTIINQFQGLNEEVEHDDSFVENLLTSKSTYFKPDLEKMKNVLAEITAVLKTWVATQENCLILARVLLTFVSADFREIDEIRNGFEDDFKMYNKLMEEVAKKVK